jgi:2-polyprenyl-6-methoxyphenol hydroxylase-like FAD-dependent oxidoreductase
MMDAATPDLCVIGAGPVGGTLACLAAAAGLRVAVIDRAALPPMEHPAFDGRAYAIAAGSRLLLEQAGVWTALPLPACAIREIHVTDGKVGRPASPLFLRFGVGELPEAGAEDAFGWMVEARSLRRALNACLHAHPLITVHAPAQAWVERSEAGARVHLADGGEFACRLVVAADGRESALRREAGIAVTRHDYHQTGIVTAIAHELPHNGSALEHFLPAGPFAQLGRAQYLGDRLDRAHAGRRLAPRPRRCRLRPPDQPPLGRPSGGDHAGGAPLVLSAVRAACASVHRHPPRAGGGRGARHSPDRGTRAQSGVSRCGRARRADERGP